MGLTIQTPSESENVNNNHAYEYDANGNLVYVNTSRTKKDGMADEKTAERKFKWDEENRLLASDDNGFVTNYWYDADGERTVKTSGESDQVYVNSEFAGGRTNTAKFSLYVSPYLVANQGGRYTKHIYIGSQRVVSKIGDFDSYGSDPRRIQYAGSETDGLSVDYKQKYAQQLQVIKDNYATFAVPYNGEDNNDYVDGKGFCCNDGSLEAAQARVMARAAKNNFQEGDAYEKMQFYYHPDHLGSSSYITNLDGEVVQYIEYVPFGEVFIEERNNVWNTPYLFNAKEFDEETGLYYYGARYYDPRLSLWMSTDPMQEKYPQHTSYLFVGSNPVNAIDPDGNKIVFINGKIGGGSPKAGASYWNGNNSDFVKGAKSFFHDDKVAFTDADYGYLSTAKGRETSGYEYAKAHYKQWVSDMKPDEAFNLVSHSMGGAFSKGIEKYLKEMGRKVEYNLMINTYQVDRIHNPKSNETFYIDYQNTNDPVLFWFDINLGYGSLKNSDVKIREKSGDVGILYIHRFPIDSDSKFWEKIQSHLPSNQ